jgi:hypothetical protein
MGQKRLMTNVLADWINCGREWPATIKTFEKNALVLKQERELFFELKRIHCMPFTICSTRRIIRPSEKLLRDMKQVSL